MLLVVLAMLLVSLWRRESHSDRKKWTWTAVMVGPVVLSVLVIGLIGISPGELLEGLVLNKQPFSPPLHPVVFKTISYGIFFLPFSGILAWLLMDR